MPVHPYRCQMLPPLDAVEPPVIDHFLRAAGMIVGSITQLLQVSQQLLLHAEWLCNSSP